MTKFGVLNIALGCVLAWPGAALHAADAPGDAILGKWWFPKKNGQMEITQEKGVYSGKVVAYDDEAALDKHNPDPELAKRPFLGILMLQDFTYDADGAQWVDGTIYDGESGKTYKCKMWFDEGDKVKLNVRGFIGIAILGRTEIFTRVTAEDERRAAEEAARKAAAKKDAAEEPSDTTEDQDDKADDK